MSEAPKTKNARSPIWLYFEPVDVKNTKCLICESIYRNSGNTTNLIDHLKRKHRAEYNEVAEMIKSNSQPPDPVATEEPPDLEIPTAVQAINPKLELESSQVVEEHAQPEETAATEGQNSVAVKEMELEEAQDVQIVKIVPLPHARSEVWNYFGFVANDEGNILDRTKVVCKICASTFCYSGNTTNFYSHLKAMHSEIQLRATSAGGTPSAPTKSGKRAYSNMMEDGGDSAGAANNTDSGSGSSNVVYFADDEPLPERSQDGIVYIDDITQYIIDFMVYDCRPLCVVQGKGFQRLLRLLAPGYTLPDKQKLANALRKRYEEMRKERETGNTTATLIDGKYSSTL